jgi:hypothetical protein
MRWRFLFQNIYGFLKNDQILTDLWEKYARHTMFFEKFSRFFEFFFPKILRYKNMWLIRKRGEPSYLSMTDDASLLHLLRALKKFNEIYWKYTILIRFFWIYMKKIHFENLFCVFLRTRFSIRKIGTPPSFFELYPIFFFCFKGLSKTKLLINQFF